MTELLDLIDRYRLMVTERDEWKEKHHQLSDWSTVARRRG